MVVRAAREWHPGEFSDEQQRIQQGHRPLVADGLGRYGADWLRGGRLSEFHLENLRRLQLQSRVIFFEHNANHIQISAFSAEIS